MVGARILVRGVWIKSKACLGWLVGCLLYLPRSRSTESVMIKEKTQRERSTSVRYRPHITGRVGIYVHGRQNRTTNPQKIRYGAMRKVMIGFVFPIGK